MKTTLIPVDFSDASENAALYASGLCSVMDTTPILMYVQRPLYPDLYIYLSKKEIKELEGRSKLRLSKLSEAVGKNCTISPNLLIKKGEPAEEITKAIKAKKPWLTVMGIPEKNPVEWMIFGSVSMSVIKKADFPVLIVPEKARFKQLRHIVFATDYHDSDSESIHYLCKIGREFNSKITILHVADGKLEIQDESACFSNLKKEIRLKVPYKNMRFHLLENKHIATELDDFVNENHVDMVAVSKQKKSYFPKLFMQSITKKMLYHTAIPVLVFQATDDSPDDYF